MGHRALIGETQKDGKVKWWYSQWGATNTHDCGKNMPKVPQTEGKPDGISKNVYDFVKKDVNYLHHEAIWIDKICYIPVWLFPSDSVEVGKWKSDGQGVLIKVKNQYDVDMAINISDAIHNIDDLTPNLSIKEKIELMENYVIGKTYDGQIPEFSPYGYKKYRNMRQLYDEILSRKKPKSKTYKAKGVGTGWHGERQRHSMARKGVKTR